MRTLQRNRQTIWFCTYHGLKEEYDEDGNLTGEHSPLYDAPCRASANVSPATGKDVVEIFGTDESYDKVLVIDWGKDVIYSPADYDGMITEDGYWFAVGSIDENTVFFVDHAPNGREAEGFDYVVKRIAKSINGLAIAIKKVNNEPQN